MVGLDAAGKSSILYRLKLGEAIPVCTTVGFNVETVSSATDGMLFEVFDIRGSDKLQALWQHYYPGCLAAVFVVDSSARARIGEARAWLQTLLAAGEISGAPVLVYANKQDVTGAMTAAEVTEELGLGAIRGREWHVQPASVVTGAGLAEGLDWLASAVRRRQDV